MARIRYTFTTRQGAMSRLGHTTAYRVANSKRIFVKNGPPHNQLQGTYSSKIHTYYTSFCVCVQILNVFDRLFMPLFSFIPLLILMPLSSLVALLSLIPKLSKAV